MLQTESSDINHTLNSDEQHKISRREALKDISIMSASFTLLLANTLFSTDTGLKILPEDKERHLCQNNKGQKIGMILGHHGKLDSSSPSTQIEGKDLFQPIGALFIDGPTILDERATVDVVRRSIDEHMQAIPNFYSEPFRIAIEHEIPIIFGDIELNDTIVQELLSMSNDNLEAGLTCLPSIALSLANMIDIYLDSAKTLLETRMSRREFLRFCALGATAIAAFRSTPAIAHISRAIGIRIDSEVGRDFQSIFSDLIHPGLTPIVMRNIVWSLKCRDLYDSGIIDDNNIINILGGSRHRFFDFFFRHPDIAQKYWKLFNYNKISAEISGGNNRWVYQSLVYYPGENRTEIIEHESLKDLT